MKKIVTSVGLFGPYHSVEILQDRYVVDGSGELPFIVIGQGTIVESDEITTPTVYVLPAEQLAIEARQQRDQLLQTSDWTQVIDAKVNQAVWAVYRQALRDIPQQADFPDNIQWPAIPTGT